MKLNKYGVLERSGPSRSPAPTVPGGNHFIMNKGGYIRAKKDQKGWRVRCEQAGDCGSFVLTSNLGESKTIGKGTGESFDFEMNGLVLQIEIEGMLSLDWGALVVSRVF